MAKRRMRTDGTREPTFRQSMAWLHTWAGLLVGWLLLFVFLTGTLSYIRREIDRWMRPELPLATQASATEKLVSAADARLRLYAAGAERWTIDLPDSRQTYLRIGWQPGSPGKGQKQEYVTEILDSRTGEPLDPEPRETRGGEVLYRMHYSLHYMPQKLGEYIVGICTMFMLVAILSGIITHKKIFSDFFTFRPTKGQRSWLDGHGLLATTALPFHMMITWSGLIFFLFAYMPVPLTVLYPDGKARDRFHAEAFGSEYERGDIVEASESASGISSMVALERLVAAADRQWGAGQINSVSVKYPGRTDAEIRIQANNPNVDLRYPSLIFDGVSGAQMGRPLDTRSAPARFNATLLGLHKGQYAGPLLRFLYVIAGLSGTGMIATGLVLWANKRKARLAKGNEPHFGIVAVNVLNLGTIVGLPIGLAAYFWANRLVPVGFESRAEWEINTMFIVWGLTFIYSIWRPQARAWTELAGLAAALWGLLPLVNTLTTGRHLGITIPAGDWGLASIDFGMLVAGLFFAFMVRTLRRKQARAALPTSLTVPTATPQPEPAE